MNFTPRCATIPQVSPAVNPQSHITPVRGWALDLGTRSDLGRVSYVELLIDGVRWYSTDDCAFSPFFSSYVNCYGLTRFDVERFYPNYPDAPRAGFLFTLDVGALLALGVRPGNHVMKVRVGDQEGTFSELPNRDGIPADLVAKETAEIAVLQGYLPARMSDAEIDALIREAIAATGAISIKDMGKVMGAVKAKAQGRADMAEVSARIKQRLNG